MNVYLHIIDVYKYKLSFDAKQIEREKDPPSAVCKERMKWQNCQAMQRRLPNVFHTLPGASAENKQGWKNHKERGKETEQK